MVYICGVQNVLGQNGAENETASPPAPSAFGAMASFLVPKLTVGLTGNLSHDKSSEQSKAFRRERQAVRPPVQHNWSLSGSNEDMKPPQIFQHELLQNFSINIFCKVEIVFLFCLELMKVSYLQRYCFLAL